MKVKIIENKLKNNLNVLFIDTNSFSTLTTLLLVGAGSRYENSRNNGIAHFFEHMSFKGGKKYPNSFVLSSVIESMGAEFNAFTAKNRTGYWIKSAAENFERVTDVLSDMLLSPLLLKEEIEKEKGVIIEEMNMYEDMPQAKVRDIFESKMFNGSSLGFEVIGKKETVSKFTRSTFLKYLKNFYKPSNALLVVAGGFDKPYKNYLSIINNKFGNWKDDKVGGFRHFDSKNLTKKVTVRNKKTEQAHFCLGFPTFSFFDKRKYVLAVLSVILGGGMSSRLFTQVREKRGLCYYIYTTRNHYSDTGYIVTQAGVSIDVNKLREAIKVTIDEHIKVAKGKVSNEELERAKSNIKGKTLLSLENSYNVASFFGRRKLLEKSVLSVDEVLSNIEKVKISDVINLAKEVFDINKLNFSVIGPFTKGDFKGIF